MDGHLKSVLASFRLTDQSHGVRIKANGHASVGKVLAKVVAIASQVKAPITTNAAEPSALCKIAAHLLERQEFFFPLRPVGSSRVKSVRIGF